MSRSGPWSCTSPCPSPSAAPHTPRRRSFSLSFARTIGARLEERFPHGGAASCAIDVLAHDRASQAAGVTLRDFLGLAGGEPPPTSFTIGIAEPAVMAERAAKAAADGFTVLKVKLGHGGELAALRAIRQRFSGTIRV